MPDFPQRWGAYVLVRPLGSGGMGSVFLALTRSGAKETVCVVKRLTPETLSDPDRRKRFRREGEISRTLSYGGIARTFEAAAYNGEPYLAQEYIEGRTVAQLCAAAASVGKQLSPLVVAYIGERVANALAYAHGLDVVHRDIAPSNVMIGFDGAVSLIDFGIARRSSDPSLTSTGDFVGRAAYSAPEVLAGQEADARSDIYSLGVLLWELLVGRSPAFEELKSQPAPSSVAPVAGIPAELDRIVIRAIDQDPGGRFQCAEDLAAALLQVTRAAGDPTKEITSLIAISYDVSLEHQRLTVDLAEARPLLPQTTSGAAARVGTVRSGRQRRWLPLSLVLAVPVVSGIVALAVHLRDRVPSIPASPVPSPATASELVPLPVLPSQPGRPPAPLVAPPVSPTPNAGPFVSAKRVSHPKPVDTAPRTPRPAAHPAGVAAIPPGLLLNRARDSLAVGQFVEAARTAGEVLESGTARQKAGAHLILGKVLLFQGKREQAADEFVDAVQLDPENASASDQLAALRRKGVE